jgi:hypothetical protein
VSIRAIWRSISSRSEVPFSKLPEQLLFSREKILSSCREFIFSERGRLSRKEDVHYERFQQIGDSHYGLACAARFSPCASFASLKLRRRAMFSRMAIA